ncbi:MAG: hypothetical protein GX077_00065 [Tissierellia bacterium]|nr:hypothetical protein [Tissierellia bacterium]
MLSYILFIVGFILIGISLLVILKDLKRSELEIEEINRIEENVKEYYKLTEEMIETFDDVIGSKIEEISDEKINFNKDTEKDKRKKIDLLEVNNNTNKISDNNIIEKIFQLQSIGLNTEEIAKKLDKGVREIEIIIKMYSSKNMDKNI